MNKFVLSLVLAILVFLMINPITQGFVKRNVVGSYTQNGNIKMMTAAIMAGVFFVLCLLFLYVTATKEGFFFEVSKNRPRCEKGFIGRPTSFEFSSNLDVNNGCDQIPGSCDGNQYSCKQVEEQKNNPHFGWDGLQNIYPNQSNIVGAMGYCQGMY
jgi:hypothetical protein